MVYPLFIFMKHYIQTTAFFLLISLVASSQNFNITAFAGFSNYQGDLQDKRFTLKQSHTAFGAGVLYDVTDKFAVRANATFGKVSGDDKAAAKNSSRNLNFTTTISDVHLGLEYSIFSLDERSLSPYVFAGISYFGFNPYSNDTLGRKIYLQPLSTEGQGFYQGRKKYSLGQIAIPFGGGVKFALSPNVRLAAEVGMRKTNTDYLDDVSTTYIDQAILFANRGQLAVEMAFRGDELKTGLSYPADGSQRGSAKSKDWYYFSGISLIVKLNSNGGGGRSNSNKYKTGCPTKF